MPSPDAIAGNALDQCSLLLKHAAENITDKDKKIELAAVAASVEECLAARNSQQWVPNIGAKFWISYNSLCSMISPVNADTLKASNALLLNSDLTLPQRSVQRYFILFVFLLVTSVVLSFFTSAVTTTNTEANSLIGSANTIADDIAKNLAILRLKGVTNLENPKQGDNQSESGKVMAALPILYANADKLYGKTNSISSMLFESYGICGAATDDSRVKHCYHLGDGGIARIVSDAQSNVDDYRFLSRRASDRSACQCYWV